MKRYKFTVEMVVEVEAPSSSDARSLIDDLFGSGAMEDFGVDLKALEIVQALTQ